MFTLGQRFPVDSHHARASIRVTDPSIEMYIPGQDETRAFVYRKRSGTLVACGILAIDREDGYVKVAIGDDRSRNVRQERVYRTHKWLTLTEEEKVLFRIYYPFLE
jgi:hypothetical protein